MEKDLLVNIRNESVWLDSRRATVLVVLHYF